MEMQSSSDITEISLKVRPGSLKIEPPCDPLMSLLASNRITMFIKFFIVTELENQYRSTELNKQIKKLDYGYTIDLNSEK